MGRKYCGKNEKLLVTSNFSFSNSAFKTLVLQTHKNQGLFGQWLRCSFSEESIGSSISFVQQAKQIPTFFLPITVCLSFKNLHAIDQL